MKQQDNQNIFEKAAHVFYGSQKQKDDEEENLRNTLLNQLGNKLETKHVLYSSIDELKKMKDEMDAQNSENNFKSKFTGAAASADKVNENSSAPLPNNNKQTNSSTKETLNEIQIESQTKIPQEQKPILLDKIPVERKEEKIVSARIAPFDCDKRDENEISAVDVKQLESNKDAKQIDNSVFSDDELRKAREFIIGSEGYREEAYQDTGGVWTIGYGHIKNVKPGDKITKEQAEELYKEDFKAHSAYLKNVKVPLNKNEKIAITSLIYNIGPSAFKKSTLLKKLNDGDRQGAAAEYDKWIYDNGKIQNGLIKRRKREKDLFLTLDDYP